MSRTAVSICILALLANPVWAEPAPQPKADPAPAEDKPALEEKQTPADSAAAKSDAPQATKLSDSQHKTVEQLAAAVLSALADNGPLAVIRPEAVGTDQNLEVLEAALMQRLGSMPPEERLES